LGADLQKKFGAEVQLVPSSGGVFEVKADNKLIFSKKKLLRFPEDGEVQNLIEMR